MGVNDYLKAGACGHTYAFGWLTPYSSLDTRDYIYIASNYIYLDLPYIKIHVKPCIKITGGTGTQANPFILENKC